MAFDPVRRNGPYAPLAADYYHDDDLAEVGEAAELLYVRGLAYCANRPTDGWMSEVQVRRFVAAGMDNVDARIEALVGQGLWERVGRGFQIRNWLKWNRSAEEIGRYRARDRERKRASKGSADAGGQDPVSPGSVPSGIRAESERNTLPVPSGVHSEGSAESAPHITTQHVTTQHVTTPSARDAESSGTRTGDTPTGTTATDNSNPDPSTPAASSRSRKPPVDPPGHTFDDFWALCPRKEGKGAARKAWEKARRKVPAQTLIDGMRRYRDASRHREPKYIAHPSTWLNQERWEDTPITDTTNRPVAPANGRHVSTAHALAGWEA